MRMLPDNPSVEFLRREAKDLLGAMREVDATASLADAQRALAQRYGARDWNDLRRDVERRREDLPVAEPGLAEALASAFALGAVHAPMVPIGYQHMGRTWVLETDRGRWLAAPVFDWIDEAQTERAVGLQERAAAAGVRTPRPVRDPDGRLVRRLDDGSWRVHEWLELGPTPIRPVRSQVARRVGEVLATVHAVAEPTDEPIGPYLTHRRPPAAWDTLVERASRAGRPWAADLAAQLGAIDALRSVEAAPRDDRIVSICDLVPEGVRYGPGDDLVLTHWDFAGPQVAEWELAHVLLQWTGYGGLNVPAARALVEGYGAASGGRAAPVLSLESFTVAVTGYLNWTFNAFCEAIDPEGREQGAFAERAIQELLEDQFTVATLEQLLAAVEPVVS